MIATSKTTIIKSIAVSLMISIGLIASSEQTPQPGGYDKIESSSSCPGMGTCTKVQTEQNDSCKSCSWWYNVSKCGCDCKQGFGVMITSVGDCIIVNIGGEPFMTAKAKCLDYRVTGVEAVSKLVCTGGLE